MNIAVTADLHLTTPEKHPERYRALESILAKMAERDVSTLLVAGDLFDETSQNYAEFDEFCQRKEFKKFKFIIVPGNHDESLRSASIAADNVEVIDTATIRTFDSSTNILFLPYVKDKTMGDFIAMHSADLNGKKWALVGHGDWMGGRREPNPHEPGVYMPLTRLDIESYRPDLVLLGHSHKPSQTAMVHYPGSPCPLDIRETGKRRFLVVDTETFAVQEETVDSDVIYFNESFVVLPAENELKFLRKQLDARVKGWSLSETDFPKVQVQIKVSGYSTNKRALLKYLKDYFKSFQFYKNGEPDLSGVAVADDVNRAEIANRVAAWIADIKWDERNGMPGDEEILLHALHSIYGN